MKNKNLLLFFTIFFFSFFLKNLLANEFSFDANEINILDNGKIIEAINGTAISSDKKILIDAKKFYYNKKNLTLEAFGDVKVNDVENKAIINSENIFYNIKDRIISSKSNTIISDRIGNTYVVENFYYSLNNKLIKVSNAKITDIENNIYQIDKAFINLKSNKLIGKDINIDLDNKSFQKNNEPRLNGKAIKSDGNESIITNGVFTVCKKTDSCPPWHLTAKEIKHDKKKKIIYYKDAWLKIYDTPVFYFPKFFHPDPTVKRQSGFLMPSFQGSSSIGSSLNTPYYHVLDGNKDLTIKPRFFSDNKLLLQTEYREVNKKSSNNFDFSFLNKSGTGVNMGHLFTNFKKKINFLGFDDSDLDFNFERSSNDEYLKTYKLESPLINDENLMHSYLEINSYSDDVSLDTSIEIYEDKSKLANNKYEFIYPNYNLMKEFNDISANGRLSLNSYGFIRQYNTNVDEKILINDFLFNSYLKNLPGGFTTNYSYLLKNSNTNSSKSSIYKEGMDNKFDGIINYKTSLPLIKKSENYTSLLSPTASLRYSPNNSKNMKNSDNRIDINNIFALNRVGTTTSVEGGSSITYGLQYSKSDKAENEIISASVANIFRPSPDKKLPNKGALNNKNSDIVGLINFSPNQYLNMNYDFSLDNNLSDKNYEMLKSEIKINNFVTTFEYLNENNLSNSANQSYLLNTSKISNDDNSKSLSFSTRENKTTKVTEFYNLLYQYRNDCLIAGLEYNKEYYNDGSLKPEENLMFKLTIIPFGQTSSPNIIK
jgi:LPS-assembly protein